MKSGPTRITPEDRRLMREMTRERVRLEYERDNASLDRREILDTMRWKRNVKAMDPRLIVLESSIDDLTIQIGRLSATQIGLKFDLAPNHVSQLTTARYR